MHAPVIQILTAKCLLFSSSEVFREFSAVTLPPFLLRHGLSVQPCQELAMQTVLTTEIRLPVLSYRCGPPSINHMYIR